MIKNEILQLLQEHRAELDRFGVEALYLFGSVARSEDRSDSDIDILVIFREKATFDRYMDLKFYLEDLFTRRVDLVTEAAIRPEIRPYIQEDLIRAA